MTNPYDPPQANAASTDFVKPPRPFAVLSFLLIWSALSSIYGFSFLRLLVQIVRITPANDYGASLLVR